MSSKFEELSKVMALYNSGAINEEELNKLKAQILEIENKETEVKKEDEIIIETPKELLKKESIKTDEIGNTIEEVKTKNDTIKKLDTLLSSGKISNQEYQILVNKTLNPKTIISPNLKEVFNNNELPPPILSKTKEKSQETSIPKVVLKPTTGIKVSKKNKLTPETEVKEEVISEKNVSTAGSKKRNWIPLIIMFGIIVTVGIVLILYVNGIFDSSKSNQSTEVVSGIAYDTKYVMSGSLRLYKEPSESSEYFHEYPFGAEINFIQGSAKEVDGTTFMQADLNGKKGWVTITTSGVDLTTSKEKIKQLESIVTGPYSQEVLESIGASSKYAILDICSINDNINTIYSDLPPIVLFRSRMGNRNSSSDKKKGINDDPKDMIFAVNKSNGQQWMYLIYFDKNFNYEIAFKSQDNFDKIVGFERITRHEKIDFEYQGNYFYDYVLEHDLVKVYYQNKNPRYYNPSASYYNWYEVAYDY